MESFIEIGGKNPKAFNDFYNFIKQYIKGHKINIKDDEMLKITALFSLYFDINKRYEQLYPQDKGKYDIERPKLLSYHSFHMKTQNMTIYHNIYDEIKIFLLSLNTDLKCEPTDIKILKLTKEERKEDHYQNIGYFYVFELFSIFKKFFNDNKDIKPKDLYVFIGLMSILDKEPIFQQSPNYIQNYKKYMVLFEEK